MAAGHATTELKQISLTDNEARPMVEADEKPNHYAAIFAQSNRAIISVEAPIIPSVMTAPNAAEFTSPTVGNRTLCGNWEKTSDPEQIQITLTDVANGTDLNDTQPLEAPITVNYQAKGRPEAAFIQKHG